MEIHQAVREMLKIVESLQDQYDKKKFTLDGRLVGDLGEILVEEDYDLVLYSGLAKHYDGETLDGRKVQIKTTMKNSLTFPVDHIPDYYIGIKIHPDGTYDEVFNGPGSIAGGAVKNRKPTKTNLHSITLSALKKLNRNVPERDRIPKKPKRAK
ncbi:hypothetical protein RGL59_000261 [Vibrio parahaemolyticus]|uniref:DUF6998 domain-containing protein n=1 Tax=Vibrio alginolyticus TaxID=663 RepID=UPI001B8402AA|nr:hypothetical protein [Vibrio parahaemolyticus]ELA7271865.1 hypothetical protein [Vibrio parahaemolyticus]ELA7340241.1 hypothetical protein [Vibrio parahaemolyticus]ELA8114128.1 hypothetical protein [Vibrio parahaemolyticus]HBC3946426.1 hypothetical protein [Vibrio parahaemolyticus]